MNPQRDRCPRSACRRLAEAAWRYRAGEGRAEELPMVAAEAIADGADTPTLCELAGLPRNADTALLRELFEQALAEARIGLPTPAQAVRYALRRQARRVVEGRVALDELVRDQWQEVPVETDEERAFVALVPPCSCCLEYTLPVDQDGWLGELEAAAAALLVSPPVGPEVEGEGTRCAFCPGRPQD